MRSAERQRIRDSNKKYREKHSRLRATEVVAIKAKEDKIHKLKYFLFEEVNLCSYELTHQHGIVELKLQY